jgi:hypothetical protein
MVAELRHRRCGRLPAAAALLGHRVPYKAMAPAQSMIAIRKPMRL